MTLRNPDKQPQAYDLDVKSAFDLPGDAAERYVAHCPWKSEASRPEIELRAGQPYTVKLEPFEVLTLEVTPQ